MNQYLFIVYNLCECPMNEIAACLLRISPKYSCFLITSHKILWPFCLWILVINPFSQVLMGKVCIKPRWLLYFGFQAQKTIKKFLSEKHIVAAETACPRLRRKVPDRRNRTGLWPLISFHNNNDLLSEGISKN